MEMEKQATSREFFLVTMIPFLVVWFAHDVDKKSVRRPFVDGIFPSPYTS